MTASTPASPFEADPIFSLGDGLPDLTEVRAYVRVPETAVSDADLDRMFGAAVQVQHRDCHHTDLPEAWPAPLVQAVLRRVQRQIAAKNLPLGVLEAAAEYGPARIPLYDAMVESLEVSYRRVVVA